MYTRNWHTWLIRVFNHYIRVRAQRGTYSAFDYVQSGRATLFFFGTTETSSSPSSASAPKLNNLVSLRVSFSLRVSVREKDTHFFAPFRRAASSLSRIAACRARCWARFSSAVIRGTMSSNGLSMIRTLLILGGLDER